MEFRCGCLDQSIFPDLDCSPDKRRDLCVGPLILMQPKRVNRPRAIVGYLKPGEAFARGMQQAIGSVLGALREGTRADPNSVRARVTPAEPQ